MARDIVVIGGSAGALQPLMGILRGLPASLPASVFIVIHTSADTPGMLSALLGKHAEMTVSYAEDGQAIRSGNVYVAPPDHHLLLQNRHMRVTRGPRENGFRPALDPLFRTAAAAYGRRVVGVVLSGGLNDGTRGLAAVKEAGGVAIVQHVEEALWASMPASAIRSVAVDHVAAAGEIAGLVRHLVDESPPGKESNMAKEHRT